MRTSSRRASGPARIYRRARARLEDYFGVDFAGVRVHADSRAARLAATFGAHAVTMGSDIVFGAGEYRPETREGSALLGHEIAHVVEGRHDRGHVHAWLTRADDNRAYQFRGRRQSVAEDWNHEELTELAIQRAGGFGTEARRILVYWVGESDRRKGNAEMPALVESFPELRALMSPDASQEPAHLRGVLHSYAGTPSSEIGIRIPNPPPPGQQERLGTRTDHRELLATGALVYLRTQAAGNYNAGYGAHGLRLLGLSLHMLEDYYSHHTFLAERDEARGASLPFDRLEDDPHFGRWRWNEALRMSTEHLRLFRVLLHPVARIALEGWANTDPSAPTMNWPRPRPRE